MQGGEKPQSQRHRPNVISKLLRTAYVRGMKPCFSLLAAVATLSLSAPVWAADPFEGYENVVQAEILPGWQTPEGGQMVGLRLVLAPGWKTYWRAPGDSGIPPSFDWSGSENLSGVTVHWPRPEVYFLNDMRTIGYKHEVVLPLELVAVAPGQPIVLNGQVDLGVCLDICMPMEISLSAILPAEAQPEPIRAALAAQPDSAATSGVGQVQCLSEPIADGVRLTATIEVAPMIGREVAVIETANPEIWVAEAEVHRSGNILTAVADMVPMDGAPFTVDPETVEITLLSGPQAISILGCQGS